MQIHHSGEAGLQKLLFQSISLQLKLVQLVCNHLGLMVASLNQLVPTTYLEFLSITLYTVERQRILQSVIHVAWKYFKDAPKFSSEHKATRSVFHFQP